MNLTAVHPSATYYSTLANIATVILSIAVVFIAGYVVYLRQQRDRYREEINHALQDLDTLIFEWSILEKYRPPEWVPPTSRYIEILSKENWSRTPLEVLEQHLKEVENRYEEAFKKEQEIRRSSQGELVAGPALYLEVKFALDKLLNAIYREFPAPPGEYTTVNGIPVSVKSFIKADFPRNRKEFLEWATKFEKFFETIHKVYMYRLRHVISHLKEIHKESAMQISRSIEEIEKRGFPYTMRKMLEEVTQLTYNEPKFYEKFFEYLFKMMHIVDKIKDLIVKYDNYTYKRKIETMVSLTAMILTGIAIPLAALYNYSTSISPLLGCVVGIGFGVSSAITVWIIYKEITSI